MTTRAQLRTSVRSVLADVFQFRDTQLNQWIEDAIRDYSTRLPFVDVGGLSVIDGVRFYCLTTSVNEGLVDVLQVEYPTGRTPRRFLTRLSEHSLAFYGGPYYDINAQNYTQSGEHLELKWLALGETPTTGQGIWLEYTRPHRIPTSDATVLSVPDAHLEVLRTYILWRAALALEVDESVSVTRNEAVIQRLGLSAARLEQTYRQRLDAISKVGSLQAEWRLDRWDRIY